MKKYIGLFLLILISSVSFGNIFVIYLTEDETFEPANATVQVGDTVEWRHKPGTDPTKFHTIYTSSFPEVAAPLNETFDTDKVFIRYKVEVAGTYNYYCYPHGPHMAGSFTASGVDAIAGEQMEDFSIRYQEDQLQIEMDPARDYTINLYSLNGLHFLKESTKGRDFLTIDLTNIPSGLYLLDVIYNERRKTIKIVRK